MQLMNLTVPELGLATKRPNTPNLQIHWLNAPPVFSMKARRFRFERSMSRSDPKG